MTPEMIDSGRRLFIGGSAASIVGLPATALSETRMRARLKPDKNASAKLGFMKTVIAGALEIGYAEAGPSSGTPVLLLHGWPYDIHSYGGVVPELVRLGYRVITPFVRGFGSTVFRSPQAVRNGQQAVLAVDTIELMDALSIPSAILAGFDWGARTANVISAIWPERCRGLVSVSGYLIGNQTVGKLPLAPRAELSWWYQFYFATERGRAGYAKYRQEFAELIWKLASPRWMFDQVTFEQTAQSLYNADHVDIVMHNYRWRQGLAEGESKYDVIEKRLATAPSISVPTITLEGDANGAPHPEPASYAGKFTGEYRHHQVSGGVGHALPAEAPQAFIDAVREVDFLIRL